MNPSPNDFGTYLLGLGQQVRELQRQIADNQRTLAGIEALPSKLNLRGIEKGVITGDPLLEAALVLCSADDQCWATNLPSTYQAMVGIRNGLTGFKGVILYDGSRQFHAPYMGEVYIGRVSDDSKLEVFPTERLLTGRDLDIGSQSLLSTVVTNFEPIDEVSTHGDNAIGTHGLVITGMFNPYHPHKETRGIYFGSDQIRTYLEALRNLEGKMSGDDKRGVNRIHFGVTSVLEREKIKL